jgi:RNA polymerase sigma factor (sigma-70 family)
LQQSPPIGQPASRPEAQQAQECDSPEQSNAAYAALLFSRYRASLHRYLSRFVRPDEADELVQETYFRLLRHGETIQLEAMARAFLYRTATNLLHDHRRRKLTRRSELHVPLDEDAETEGHAGPEEELACEQLLDIVEETIANMPAETRSVFLMSRFRDMSYMEIAGVMNLSPRTVTRKMAEALDLLGRAVGENP